jgi:predicted transcriptional regulator
MSTTELTATIVASYVERNKIAPAEIESLIRSVHSTLSTLGREPTEASAPDRPTPVQIRRSIRPDTLVSFVDGRPYKMLKRHLATHGLTPEAYRERFGLPNDYPMTAPEYAARRSAFAKAAGLGVTARGQR